MQCDHGQEKDDAGDQDDGGNVIIGFAGTEVTQVTPKRGSIADGRFEGAPAGSDQVVTRISSALRCAHATARGRRTSSRQGRARNGNFGLLRTARQLLDRATVQIAAREVHCGKAAIRAQQFVDETDALEELRPIHIREQPHARDDVANGHVRCALALMFLVDDLVRCRSLQDQVLVQPAPCRRYGGVLIAQPQHQLDGKGRRQRGAGRIAGGQCVGLRRISVQTQQSVGHIVRFLARGPAADDARGGAAQVLDQHDAQRDGDRPKLPDAQRLNALIGTHEKTQRIRIEPAVAMGDVAPSQSEHTGIADERAVRELRQLAVETRRQILANLADLLFDEVIIIQQPFGGRCDRSAFADRRPDRPIGGEQNGLVLFQSCAEGTPCRTPLRHPLGSRETGSMLLEALAAEKFGADELLVVPR